MAIVWSLTLRSSAKKRMAKWTGSLSANPWGLSLADISIYMCKKVNLPHVSHVSRFSASASSLIRCVIASLLKSQPVASVGLSVGQSVGQSVGYASIIRSPLHFWVAAISFKWSVLRDSYHAPVKKSVCSHVCSSIYQLPHMFSAKINARNDNVRTHRCLVKLV